MGTCVHFSRSLPSNSWWQKWLGGRSCQGRQPPKAGAAGPPLQDLPPSHTRPPRSTAGNISSAACLKTGPQYIASFTDKTESLNDCGVVISPLTIVMAESAIIYQNHCNFGLAVG